MRPDLDVEDFLYRAQARGAWRARRAAAQREQYVCRVDEVPHQWIDRGAAPCRRYETFRDIVPGADVALVGYGYWLLGRRWSGVTAATRTRRIRGTSSSFLDRPHLKRRRYVEGGELAG